MNEDLHIAGYDPWQGSEEYYYDPCAAEKPIRFIETYLTHVKADLARKPLLLADFQKTFIRNLFGWKDKQTELRRYSQAILFLPRGA